MALDYGILLRGPSIGQQFLAGQQAAQEEQERNMLRQMQMEQMVAQRENILAQRAQRMEEAEARRRAAEAENALAGYVRGGMPQGLAGLAQFGPRGAQAMKDIPAAQMAQLDVERKRLDYVTQRLASATPQNYAGILQEIASVSPQFAANMPQQYDSEAVTALARQGLSLKDQLEAYKPTTLTPGAVLVDPRTGRQIAAAPRMSQLLSPEEEAQRTRIARESRPPAQPREPGAPVAVVDEATGRVKYVPREEAYGKTPATAIEGLTPKERQQREAKFPQATSALKAFENTSDMLVKDLETLANHPGLASITGIAAGRLPGVTAQGREAQALYDKIMARGGFQELQNMRQASPTGGALGNVSNAEGERLQAAFAALDRRQDASSVRKAIRDAIAQTRNAKQNIRDAYDLTYEYKQQGGAASVAKPAADLATERQNARAAIAAGAPEAAVRQRFKEKTGQEL